MKCLTIEVRFAQGNGDGRTRQEEWSQDSEGSGFFGSSSCGCLCSVGVTRVVLGQGALWDTLQHLLGEDSQQLPANVQGLKDGPVLIVT